MPANGSRPASHCCRSQVHTRTSPTSPSESNIPTWFATLTLALTALSLAVAGLAEQRGTRDRVMWWALSAIFLYLWLDEATDLHGI